MRSDMRDPNLEQLDAVAKLLEPLLDEIVFIGGCTTGLLITDQAVPNVRPTFDVDVITGASYTEYGVLSEKLCSLGLRHDTREDAPICRWQYGSLQIDVMPTEEKILGFSNRWYREAILAAQEVQLPTDRRIRAITAPYFVATKLEAFKNRGKGDFAASHDLEDVIAVIDGRPETIDEISRSSAEVKTYLSGEMKRLLQLEAFIDALPGKLLPDAASQQRLSLLLTRLGNLASIEE